MRNEQLTQDSVIRIHLAVLSS